MKNSFKIFLLVSAVNFLNSCGTIPAGSLPASSLKTPKEIIGGSAITFQISTNCNPSAHIYFSPKLADGKYGQIIGISINTKLTFVSKYTADGITLNRLELPPGNYTFAEIICSRQGAYSYKTPSNSGDIYGAFNVYPNKTTYIGHLFVGVDTERERFVFTANDLYNLAVGDYNGLSGATGSSLHKELMVVPEK